MTVSSSTNRVSYAGNGSTTVFPYTYKIFDQDDLTVILRAANGTETVKAIVSDYTVSGVGSPGGGNVTMLTAPATGETLVVIRVQDLIQELDIVENDPFPAESLEGALDKLTFMVQQHEDTLSRTIRASRTNTIAGAEFTISAADRANKLFAFDSSGNVNITQNVGIFRGNWAAGVAFNERDLVKDTTTDNIFIVNTAHVSSGALPITTNADAAKFDLILDVSAFNVLFDQFETIYLGSKSSDPATDNDGDPLIDGALYFNTTDNRLKVYDLGNTVWKFTAPSPAEQININALGPIAADVSAVAAIDSDVTTVAGMTANVATVAGIAANVTTVAGISADVTAVAGDAADIGTVATSIADVSTVAGVAANVTTVAGISANVTTVAGIPADVTSVAGVAANVTTVAGISANVTTVAGISADVTTVAGISANVTTVSGVSSEVTTVSGFVSEINTVADDLTAGSFVAGSQYDFGSITDAASGTSGSPDGFIVTVFNNLGDIAAVANIDSDVTAVAGIAANVTSVAGIAADVSVVATNVADVTNFADVYYGPSATAPTLRQDGSALQPGDLYFNTASDLINVWDGTQWQAAVASLSGALVATNNLSDLTNTATARTNLGLGSAATSATSDFAAASHTHILSEITDAGTMASQNANNVNITGGVIDGGSIA